jgi:predicted transcriptional regulator
VTTVDIRDDLKEKMDKYIQAKGITKKAFINHAIEEFLNKSKLRIF